MNQPGSGAVLITGCSTGIGHATAARLARGGRTVYATARRPQTLSSLAAQGCRTLALDVTDEASMSAAVATVEEEAGGIEALVNNAGYSQGGPLEEVPLEEVRRQFETNVFGLLRMCQLVLPGMRGRRRGRIVNVGSMGGRLTFPGGGPYHATKYAVEALSDALRFEVAGFGIQVVLLEPGLIRTNFGVTAVGSIDAVPSGGGPYADFATAVAATTAHAYSGPTGRVLGAGPEAVARVIERAITASRPRARYVVTPGARAMIGLRAVLPDRAFDAVLARQFPRPGR
ncbi:MAG: SDR family NAD(P)-dependent oxidoreductase [Chloroflexi bacterium]|nr:MAG: SDR family NAD(P)-dependent oxidoreductase [Chloroflexota bacterium]